MTTANSMTTATAQATGALTPGQNNAGQIVATVGYTAQDGWAINGNLYLWGTPSGTGVGPGIIQANNAPDNNVSATITINNVPAGTYDLLGTFSIKQVSTGAGQMIGSPRSAGYTVK